MNTFFEQLFSTLSGYNTVVVFFIIGIFWLTIAAFISLIRVRGFYKREQTQLDKLEGVLKTLEQQSIETIDELRTHLVSAFQRNYYTLAYERIEFVLKLAEMGKLKRIQAVGETMQARKLARQQSYFAHFVISVLLIIGLAGTLWAFENILTNSAIQENDIKLENYTPAMLTSMAGFLGTIFLLFVKFNLVQPVQERFFSHLDWITEIDLIPICSQFEKPGQFEQTLLNAVEAMGGNCDKLTKRVHNYLTHLEETQKGFTRSQQPLVAGINEIPEKFKNLVDDYAVILQTNKRYLDKLGTSLKGVNDATKQLEHFMTSMERQIR